MPAEAETRIRDHNWVPHGKLKINFDMNAIRFPDGNTVHVDHRHLEALLTIPPDATLSLEEIAKRIERRRASYQKFPAALPISNSTDHKSFRTIKMTRRYLRTTISELNHLTTEQLIQHTSVENRYRLNLQYS